MNNTRNKIKHRSPNLFVGKPTMKRFKRNKKRIFISR